MAEKKKRRRSSNGLNPENLEVILGAIDEKVGVLANEKGGDIVDNLAPLFDARAKIVALLSPSDETEPTKRKPKTDKAEPKE